MQASHLHRQLFLDGVSRADLNFDVFGRTLTNDKVMHFLEVLGNRLGQFIACHPYRLAEHSPLQTEHRDLSRTPANINDHIACRIFHRQARTNRGGDWLFDQINFAGACLQGCLHHGPTLNTRHAAGNTNHNSGRD